MHATQKRKIKRYLGILDENRYYNTRTLQEIEYCNTDYKTGNVPPKKECFMPYESGSAWGTGNDSHAWFHTKISVPEEMKNAPLELSIASDNVGVWDACNPQYIVYVDGKLRQGADINHTFVTLEGKDEYDVYLYGYTGPRIASTRLYLALRNRNELIDGLYYDIAVPFETIDFLDENSREYSVTLALLDEAVSMLELYNVGDGEFFKSAGTGCLDNTYICDIMGNEGIKFDVQLFHVAGFVMFI